LSTPLENEDRGHRQGRGVASTDDIHMPVEKPEKKREQQEKRDESDAKPPGQFVTDDLEEQTARFIEAVKGLARRRQEREAAETWGPPPGSGGNHRSRRR
jgi:hypothetical protein